MSMESAASRARTRLWPYAWDLQRTLAALQIFDAAASFATKASLLPMDLMLLALGAACFRFIRNGNEKRLRGFGACFRMQMAVGAGCAASCVIWAFPALDPTRPAAAFAFCAGALAALVAMGTEKIDAKLGEMETSEAAGGAWETASPGDVKLGVDKETGEEVRIKYKDRFLHTLVLGPTGCGKTSQIITPMVYQDIKNREIGVIVLEPKGDLAEKVFALAKKEGRKVHYFNPEMSDCPYFNPLRGSEDDVVENLVTTLKSFDTDSSTYFQDSNENLIRRGTKVVKRLYGDDATLVQLDRLINNVNGDGVKMIKQFMQLKTKTQREKNDNDSISSWFMNEYLPGTTGARGASQKTFESSSGVRNQIQKLIANPYLNRILNPPAEAEGKKRGGEQNYIDFADIIAEGEVCAISSAQGKLRGLGKFLGFFLILQMQSAIFSRPGNEETRRGCMLYIDEFQSYANTGMQDLLTQGRSYRVGCVLATQNRSLIGQNSGRDARAFTDIVSTNARNVVIFPGANAADANYYAAEFGDTRVEKERISYSRKRYGYRPSAEGMNISTQESYEYRFRPSEIIYREFGEAMARIIKDNSVEEPRVLKLSFIDAADDEWANRYIARYKETRTAGFEDEPAADDAEEIRSMLEGLEPLETEEADEDEIESMGFLP